MTPRDLVYLIGRHGWGPKSEHLPGFKAAVCRRLHVWSWAVFVWPVTYLPFHLRRGREQLRRFFRGNN
jgi:hypothetical protein